MSAVCVPLCPCVCVCVCPASDLLHCRRLFPADVDTPEPDEKSVLTYVSSLYDIFPQPPAEHPLYDAVSSSSSDLTSVIRTTTTRITSTGTGTSASASTSTGHYSTAAVLDRVSPPGGGSGR